jgi:tRNA1(Val) A37 N6-methylase TrmN6
MCLQFVLYLKSKKVEVLAVEAQKEEAKGSEKEVKNDEENKNESQERILEKEKNTSSKKQEKKM